MDEFTDQAGLVVVYLVTRAVRRAAARRARHSGGRSDVVHPDAATDAILNRLEATVAEALPWVPAKLTEEAENGQLSESTLVQVQVALEEAAYRDLPFRQKIMESVTRLREMSLPEEMWYPVDEEMWYPVDLGARPAAASVSVPEEIVPEQIVSEFKAALAALGNVQQKASGSAKDGAGRLPSTLNGTPASGTIDGPFADDLARVPVSIYLAESGIHEQVEAAVEQWLTTADVSIRTRDEPVTGSWFRRMMAGIKKAASTPAGREAVLTAKHVADSRLVQTQDAYVTATLLQNVGPVLQSLHPTKDAVVRAGALLIVKVDWVVQVYQLTAAQQAILDHEPCLVTSPREIIAALRLSGPDAQEVTLPPAVRRTGQGEAATAGD